jgi:trigger factor
LLKVTTEPREKCEVLMTVEVDDTRSDHALKAAARRIAAKVQIPGFRPGKAPYALVARRFGEKTIRQEALEDLGESVFREALEQVNLEPYAPASMEDISWSPLVMKVRVPIPPIVELGDYRSLRLEAEPVEVTEAEIDEALIALQEERAGRNVVERPSQLGDKIHMAIQIRVGDRIIVDDDDAEYVLRLPAEGEGPDLSTPMLDLSAGDEKTFTIAYPESYSNKELAGQDAEVSVLVKSIQERELYPLDDDFAQMIGDFGTLEQLKDNLRESALQRKQREADQDLASEAFEKVVADAPRVEWPAALEEATIDRWIENLERQLQRENMPFDSYLRAQQKTREQLREDFRPGAQKELRLTLVAREIANKEGLSVGVEEVASYIDLVSQLSGERSESVRQSLTNSEASVRQIAQDLLGAKVRDRLLLVVKGQLPQEGASTDALPGVEADQAETPAQPEAIQAEGAEVN